MPDLPTRLAAVLLPLAFAAVAAPTAAQAVTVNDARGTILVNESRPGETNDVRVRPFGDGILISDSAGETGSAPCAPVNGDLACPLPGQVQMFLGGGDDRVEYQLAAGGFAHLGEGDDRVLAGVRRTAGTAVQPFSFAGATGTDTVSYGLADAGVTVDLTANGPLDGRPGDREDVLDDFERLLGSPFDDTLLGSARPDAIVPGRGQDTVAGGAGDDVFSSHEADGADDYHGGPGRDSIDFAGRSKPLAVSLDNAGNDGETLEFDNVRSNVENLYGGAGPDTLSSLGASSRLDGRDGRDTLLGGDGPDTLIGGPGLDSLQAGAGTDALDARDGGPDRLDCGTEPDSAARDAAETSITGCEVVAVGVLRLADRTVTATAGEPAAVALRWRHPRAWQELRTITVRVLRDGVAVGEATIAPRGRRLSAAGHARLVRGATRVTRQGRTVSARLALRLAEARPGARFELEIEAVDRRGRRQLEPRAGTIRFVR